MNSSRRSLLRERLRVEAAAKDWRALIAEYGTPLLVLDPGRVVEQYRLLTTHLRGVGLHYAVKALPHPAVLTAIGGLSGITANPPRPTGRGVTPTETTSNPPPESSPATLNTS